jgi:hypothetical protein
LFADPSRIALTLGRNRLRIAYAMCTNPELSNDVSRLMAMQRLDTAIAGDVRLFVSAQVWQSDRGRPQDLAETHLTCALPDFLLEQSVDPELDHALLKKNRPC